MAKLASRKLKLEEFNQLFVVEYSISQNSVGVKSVNEMLDSNRQAISQKLSSDYLPVAFFASREEAVEMSNKLTDNIREIAAQLTKFDSERDRMFDDTEDKLWSFFRTLDSEPREK